MPLAQGCRFTVTVLLYIDRCSAHSVTLVVQPMLIDVYRGRCHKCLARRAIASQQYSLSRNSSQRRTLVLSTHSDKLQDFSKELLQLLAMDRASMLSLKRRLSSLSLRQKTPNDSGPNERPNINGEGDRIRAGLPGSQEAVELPLSQSTGTITPLINGIRDIIEDVLPMPSARHVPPDLQRRLSTLPSTQASHSQQPSASWDGRQTRLQNDPETRSADVLVIEDGPVVPAREGIAFRGRQDPISQPLQNSEAQQVLPSENSLVWDLPQLPSTSSSRPRTQGMLMISFPQRVRSSPILCL